MILRLDSDGNPKLSADSNLVLAVLASSPRGGSHVKRTGVLVIPFRDLKKKNKNKNKKNKNNFVTYLWGVQPQKVHSGNFCNTF